MIITCDKCGSKYKIKDELVADGPKRAKCRNCGNAIVIGQPAPPAGAAESAARPEVKQPAGSADTTNKGDGGRATAAAAAAAGEAGTQTAAQEGKGAGAAGEAGVKQGDETPEETAARQQEDIQKRLEKRRLEMEDEISGRLNKAALETLDFEVLTELANKLKRIERNPDYRPEQEARLFTCIQCKTIFAIYPDDSRFCPNCSGEAALVRGEDILRQFGMFG
ncbi:MAG: zinc-ribbon domain-containing protein [Candidatus Glassbacteria bacterium]